MSASMLPVADVEDLWLAGLADWPLRPLMAEDWWGVWKAVPKPDGNGKPDKKPTPKADQQWWPYERARSAFDNGGGYAGLGFHVLKAGRNAADLDNCIDPETGEIDCRAEDFLAACGVAYVEISPSGTGLKVIGARSDEPTFLQIDFKDSPVVISLITNYSAVTFRGSGDPDVDISAAIDDWKALTKSGEHGSSTDRARPLPEVVDDGARNVTLFKEGCRMRRLGWDEAEICAALVKINERRCKPPLSEEDVATIAHSAAGKDKAEDTFPATEAGDAEFFASIYSDRVRFDHRRGRWVVFDGQHWTPPSDGEVARLALEAIRARQRAAVGNKERMKWAANGEARKRLTNLTALAQSVRPLADSGDAWDADQWLLGVRNGVVDLRTGGHRPGAPEDRITLRARASFREDAACPLWEQTLGQIFGKAKDLIAYFQRVVGYSLTGDCREEVLFLCWGSGANGKGTLMNTLAGVLGDYADDLPFSALELHDRASIPNDIAKIVGKRFVTSSESGEAKRLNEARVKALTGRDPITARFLHREFFTFQPSAKFWLATNHRPVVRDTSLGFWRRIHLIPFTQTFAGKPDLTLKDRLLEEADGILSWAIRGSVAWQREGLMPPDVVLKATSSYREQSMPLARFIDERCVLSDKAQASFGELFAAYLRWCGNARDVVRLGRHEFSEALHERFKTDPNNTRNVIFLGVGLADQSGDHSAEGSP